MSSIFCTSFSTHDPAIKDLLLDIATEEISHLEMVGSCITQLMDGADKDPSTLGGRQTTMMNEGQIMSANNFVNNMINGNSTVQKSTYLDGHGLDFVDSSGTPFTGNYINNVADLRANIQSNLAAELRARKVYEELHRHVSDPGAREMFDFLIQREEAHAALFDEAIEKIQDMHGGGYEKSFNDKQFSIMYGDLSQGGTASQDFKLADDASIFTGPFSGVSDTRGANLPMQ